MNRLYIMKKKSAKSGKEYTALFLDKGEKTFIITFDKFVIMRVADMTFAQFEEIPLDTRIDI